MWFALVAFVFATNVICEQSEESHRYYIEHHFIANDPDELGRNAMKSSQNKWPDGIVPYRFGDEYIERDRAKVLNAMEGIRRKTCIKFITRKSFHKTYIEFKKSNNGCGTMVGFRANNKSTDVLYSERCLDIPGAIQHELLHTLGLWHEQSRNDRDEYVEILWDNILPGEI